MTRKLVCSFAFTAVAAYAMLAAPQASARAIGGFSIDTTGPVTPTPNDPWGGVMLCTANLRKPVFDSHGNITGWQYQMASGYSYSTCLANANIFLSMGYQPNPNPGTGFCACHPGFNGFMVSSPSGNGPISVQNLSLEQIRAYDEGLLELRQKYQLDKFAEEHEQLLQAIEAMPGSGDN
jgi:hypothetical protein